MEQKKFIIRQISIFSENKPGRLAAIAKALQEEGINILAFSIAEADGFGVVRALVDKPQKAFEKLSGIGFNVAFTDVIAVQMKDIPGGLYEIARILGDGKINIEYSYAYSGRDAAVLILRVDDVGAAISVITKGGGTLLESSMFQ
ncbi:MAG TPA: ACT domain-containing protein [Methanoregulaceae archaeon]|nr:MAG: ACT domain-containing protein [Methanolinea sp.]HON81026.1 ACT domain-containing protein [Methanoregulaceae archaeon]HPD10225.1 ACT domain-containing protein [Methanoregulaceae archaeon]HRT14612.1 ACT domain-containing protein [Methanoregulaceae archaeon]HRU30183.1 ACT domain-containing protein [Methanoregulaceae archaeon]